MQLSILGTVLFSLGNVLPMSLFRRCRRAFGKNPAFQKREVVRWQSFGVRVFGVRADTKLDAHRIRGQSLQAFKFTEDFRTNGPGIQVQPLFLGEVLCNGR